MSFSEAYNTFFFEESDVLLRSGALFGAWCQRVYQAMHTRAFGLPASPLPGASSQLLYG